MRSTVEIERTDVCKCRELRGNIIYDSVESDNDEVEKKNENYNADDNA